MPQRNRCNCRKPPRSLMGLFFSAQTTHFRDTDFLNAGSSQAALHSRYCSSLDPQGVSWALCRDCFCLTQHPKQFRSVAGIAPVNPIVKDHSGTILDRLKRAPKFHRLIKFPLADGLRFRVERIDPLGDRLLSLKLLLGLAENGPSELDLLPKPLLELNRRIRIFQDATLGRLCGSAPWCVWPARPLS